MDDLEELVEVSIPLLTGLSFRLLILLVLVNLIILDVSIPLLTGLSFRPLVLIGAYIQQATRSQSLC